MPRWSANIDTSQPETTVSRGALTAAVKFLTPVSGPAVSVRVRVRGKPLE
jgi:hypothetical protein